VKGRVPDGAPGTVSEPERTDPAALYARVEALVDPAPASDRPALEACARFLRDALPPGHMAALEAASEFPVAELAAFARHGLARELVPEDLGGTFEWSRLTRICARLAAHELDFTLCLGGAVLGALPILVAGSAAHRTAYFTPLARGEMGGLGLTEWAHGSDLLAGDARADPIDAAGRPATLEAATHFRLEGTKAPINNGTRAACLVLLARTGGDDPMFAHSLFVVPRETPGLEPHARFATLGHRCMDLSGAVLRGAVVPRAAMMGAPGEGFVHARRALEISRSGVATMALGATATALAQAVDHARTRHLYGAPIDDLGGVQTLLARSFARFCASAALARRAARTVAHAPLAGRGLSCAAKYLCPTLLEETVADSGTLLGARSLLDDFPFSRLRRSAPVLAVFDGSSQLQLDELWRHAASWKGAGSLSGERALSLLRDFALPPRTPFEPGRDDAGESAATTPAAMLAAIGSLAPKLGLAPFAVAARLVSEAAGGARRMTQATRFRISDAAARLWAASALAEAYVLAETVPAREAISGALLLYLVDLAGPLASALVEIAPAHAEEASAVLRVASRAPEAREAARAALRRLVTAPVGEVAPEEGE
jgi:alkylation response protein AidB-like acyl-CoA dehydrogenase